jgi:hypothetical protein
VHLLLDAHRECLKKLFLATYIAHIDRAELPHYTLLARNCAELFVTVGGPFSQPPAKRINASKAVFFLCNQVDFVVKLISQCVLFSKGIG